MRIFLRFIILSVFIGCSEPANPSEVTFVAIDPGVHTTRGLDGKIHWPNQTLVRLEAQTQMLNYKEPLHLQLKVQMLNADSFMRLNMYTTDLKTNDGTSLEFKRSGSDLLIRMYSRDFPELELCEMKSAVSRTGDVDIRLQLVNDSERGPHVLIWNRYFDGRSGIKKEYSFFSEKNAECSSLEKIILNHFGHGRKWGIDIYQTRITSCIRSEVL